MDLCGKVGVNIGVSHFVVDILDLDRGGEVKSGFHELY